MDKLALSKLLAKPIYKLGLKIIQLADKVDGKQPNMK